MRVVWTAVAAVAVAAASGASAGAAADKTCAAGKLIKIRTDDRRGGPLPPTKEDGGADVPRRPLYGQIHYLTLQCGDVLYVGRFQGGRAQPEDELKPGAPVKFRIAGDRIYVTTAGGDEIEGRVGTMSARSGPGRIRPSPR